MPSGAQDAVYDVAIIGGGIAGAGIARDAALRGLSVVLFEKNTFGSGTSSKSSKLIHGGIRYLETAWKELKHGRLSESWKNFIFVFVSLKESRILERIAPDLVLPILLVIPIYKDHHRNRWAIYAGSFLYFLLAFFSGKARVPRILWTKAAAIKLLPGLEENGLLGGVVIWDHVTDDKRLVEEIMRSAQQNGAQAIQNAKVIRYRYDTEKIIYEITVEKGGESLTFFSRKLVNASGPWVDITRATAGKHPEDYLLPIAGSHITFKKFIPYSVILEAKDGRIFFVINTGEASRVGTTERPWRDPDSLETSPEEVDYLLTALKKYFPKIIFDPKDILSKDSGVRPLARPSGKDAPTDISREHSIRRDELGVLHVLGVKLTDHRRAAEQVVNLLTPKKTVTHLVPL